MLRIVLELKSDYRGPRLIFLYLTGDRYGECRLGHRHGLVHDSRIQSVIPQPRAAAPRGLQNTDDILNDLLFLIVCEQIQFREI